MELSSSIDKLIQIIQSVGSVKVAIILIKYANARFFLFILFFY